MGERERAAVQADVSGDGPLTVEAHFLTHTSSWAGADAFPPSVSPTRQMGASGHLWPGPRQDNMEAPDEPPSRVHTHIARDVRGRGALGTGAVTSAEVPAAHPRTTFCHPSDSSRGSP